MRRSADRPASPGRQLLVLVASVVLGFLFGTALGAPFDIDVGAGHAVFHLVVGAVVGIAAWWLHRCGSPDRSSRFARWSAAALAIMQLVEGAAAVPDGSGGSIGHAVPGFVNLVVLQPMVLVAMVVLAVAALRRRPPARP